MLGKVTFDEQVNVSERFCKCDISCTFTKPGSLYAQVLFCAVITGIFMEGVLTCEVRLF